MTLYLTHTSQNKFLFLTDIQKLQSIQSIHYEQHTNQSTNQPTSKVLVLLLVFGTLVTIFHLVYCSVIMSFRETSSQNSTSVENAKRNNKDETDKLDKKKKHKEKQKKE